MHPSLSPAAPLMSDWARSAWNFPLDIPPFVLVAPSASSQAAKVLAAFASSGSVISQVNVIDPEKEWNIVVRANLNDQPFDVLRYLPLAYEATVIGPEASKTVTFAGMYHGVLIRVCATFPDRSPFPAIIRSHWMVDEDRDEGALAEHLRLKVAAERV